MNLSKNQEKIIEISKKLGLSHIGSNLSCLPVLEEIYAKKELNDIVILDNAHAHLAHLVVSFNDNEVVESLIKRYGIHCDRDAGCDAYGGSLGHGLGIAIGYALSNPKRDVYVTVSDGSMMEGSSWEALQTIDRLYREGNKFDNLHIYTNFNGYTAVAKVDQVALQVKMATFCPLDINIRFTNNLLPELEGLQGHYDKL